MDDTPLTTADSISYQRAHIAGIGQTPFKTKTIGEW
jgi:hypothetical protein